MIMKLGGIGTLDAVKQFHIMICEMPESIRITVGKSQVYVEVDEARYLANLLINAAENLENRIQQKGKIKK